MRRSSKTRLVFIPLLALTCGPGCALLAVDAAGYGVAASLIEHRSAHGPDAPGSFVGNAGSSWSVVFLKQESGTARGATHPADGPGGGPGQDR